MCLLIVHLLITTLVLSYENVDISMAVTTINSNYNIKLLFSKTDDKYNCFANIDLL
jgi:hypothetical protein